jgi:hypothetical protein
MKKIYFLISLWLVAGLLSAQVSKTVNATAGNLQNAFTTTERATVTNITVTGTLDARDFNFMRKLTVLSVIDLSAVTIQEYIGTKAYNSNILIYPANELPSTAFGTSSNAISLPIKTITLPTSITSIGDSAFFNCYNITSIIIPNSVTAIGDSAFSACAGLTSITIPSSVTSIGCMPFNTTPWYTSWLNSQPEGVVYIGKVAYAYKGTMSANTSITLREGTTEIAYYAFNTCSNLTSITIPDSVISIEEYAFRNCTSLTSINIPSSVTSIGLGAFVNCTSITSISIPSSVTAIGDAAFLGTAWYTNHPDGLVYAGKVVYKYKGSMPVNISIILNEDTVGIAENAFYKCTSLTSVTIPNSVNLIGDYAFNGCSGITSITIPDSVTSLGEGAFYDCTGLTSISIPNSVVSIGIIAFDYCSNLTSITIPSSVNSIGASTFYNCTGLTSITIPNSVVSIGNNAFYNCTSLNSISIPNSVSSIGYYAFEGCSSLTSITIPNSLSSIANGAFYGCTSLTSIYANATTPVDLSSSLEVFNGVNKTTCFLYVPVGSKAAYKAANQWKDFKNIVESNLLNTTSLPTNELIKVYPNPANNFIAIKGLKSAANLSIYNLLGQEVLTRTIIPNETIEISSLSQGVYIVKVNSLEGAFETKLIKE